MSRGPEDDGVHDMEAGGKDGKAGSMEIPNPACQADRDALKNALTLRLHSSGTS